ncbi:MAG TPA: hypothetical protein VMD28_02450, partial [Acidimicrobiales bacterium]|nr:hypothetical protein [Acidimicrobiales bacterium]
QALSAAPHARPAAGRATLHRRHEGIGSTIVTYVYSTVAVRLVGGFTLCPLSESPPASPSPLTPPPLQKSGLGAVVQLTMMFWRYVKVPSFPPFSLLPNVIWWSPGREEHAVRHLVGG